MNFALNAFYGFLLMTSIFGLYYLLIKFFLNPEKLKKLGSLKFILILAFILKLPVTVLALYLLVKWAHFSVIIFMLSFILTLLLWSFVLIYYGDEQQPIESTETE